MKRTIYETSKAIAPDVIRTTDRRAEYIRKVADDMVAQPMEFLVRTEDGKKVQRQLWMPTHLRTALRAGKRLQLAVSNGH